VRLSLPPRFSGVRVVGDVHGEAAQFDAAVAGAAERRLFLVQLGDLTDHGPDSPGVLAAMAGLLDRGAGLFLLGNHDHKLRRALTGSPVRIDQVLAATLGQLAAHPDGRALSARAAAEVARAPAWLAWGKATLFVHGGFHPTMLHVPPPPDAGARRPEGAVSRALYGQTVRGELTEAGYPMRVLAWVDLIPEGFTVYCGHDMRSTDGRPHIRRGRMGGTAVFMDTGAGKGGHLSWLDLAAPDGEVG